jgi:hypothetical protein
MLATLSRRRTSPTPSSSPAPHCKRTFTTKHGLSVHIGRWCGEAEREKFAHEVASITDARGPPNNRQGQLARLQSNLPPSTELRLGDPGLRRGSPNASCSTLSLLWRTTWQQSPYSLTDIIAYDTEHRCESRTGQRSGRCETPPAVRERGVSFLARVEARPDVLTLRVPLHRCTQHWRRSHHSRTPSTQGQS